MHGELIQYIYTGSATTGKVHFIGSCFYPQVELPSATRVHRSMSLSARQSRSKVHKEEPSEGGGSLKRSSSVKGRSEKAKESAKDSSAEKKNEKNKGKVAV